MRRRTKKIGAGNSRLVIYIAVIAIMWLVGRVYTKYIEPHEELIESFAEDFTPSKQSEPAASEKPSAQSDSPAKSNPSPTTPKSAGQNKSQSRGKAYRSGWAELPATPQHSQLYFTSHLHNNTQRNYSACFSSKYHCPVWVAAPLHDCYKGDAKRSDSFTFDPTISIDFQPSLSRSFGQYTRGHLLGSAERNASREMNKQTFYATNIAPQLREGFNAQGGAWNNIERVADRQICADTLYVVTGCLFDDYTHHDGRKVKASTTKNKNDGKQIGVPTAYYKAMLRTKRGSTGKSVMECSSDELKCAAIIVPHTSASKYKPSKKDLISIEELERLSGVEFFVNVENAPKKRVNPSDWGL